MKKMKIVIMALVVTMAIAGSMATYAKDGVLTARFTGDVNTGAAPLTVHFTDTSEGNPTSWHWDFGDGSYSTLQNPVYTYNNPGRYTVTLTVSDGTQSDTASGDIVVTNQLLATPTPAPTTIPVIVRPVPIKDPHHGKPPHDGKLPEKHPPKKDRPPEHKRPVSKPNKTVDMPHCR